MKFLVIPPAQFLKDFIQGYVFIDLYNNLPHRKCSIPVGYPVIGIQYGLTPLLSINNKAPDYYCSLFCGLTETPIMMHNQGLFQAVLVLFHPLGISRLFRIPQQEITNQLIPMDYISLVKRWRLIEKIIEARGDLERSEILNQFFSLLLLNVNGKYRELQYAVDLIHRHNGNLKIEKLATDMRLNIRTFERKFKNVVGLCPKRYCRQVRLQKLLKYYITQNGQDLHDQIYQFGFFDQAHLLHNLKSSLGCTFNKIEEDYRDYIKLYKNYL